MGPRRYRSIDCTGWTQLDHVTSSARDTEKGTTKTSEGMNMHVFKNPDELSVAVADWIVNEVEECLQRTDRFAFLLSGGNTPKKLYELLASDRYRNRINWEKIDVFFGDERVVPV